MPVRFPRLYAISDTAAADGRPHREIVAELLAAGVGWIQLREKSAPAGAFLDEARACVERAQAAGALLFINDRPDVARLAGAAGVHLGADDLPLPAARAVLPPGARIGVSTHSVAAAEAAATGADYVALGPIAASTTAKRDWRPLGLEPIRRLRGRLPVPLVAIGGLDPAAAAAALEAGADAVAVIGGLLRGGSIRERVRAYEERIGSIALREEGSG